MIGRSAVLTTVALCASTLAFGDFQYQQTTRLTGGSMLGMLKMMGRFSSQMRQGLEPITQNVYLQGNRMAHVGKDSTEIIDLDKQTITHIDHAKKQYSVMTFEQARQAMEAAAKEAEQKMNQKGASPDANKAEVNFKAKVRDGGQSKQFSGLDTHLTILTLEMEATDKESGQKGAMAVTSDMWLAPDVPGYDSVREFYKKYAEKMGLMMDPALNSMAAAMQRNMMKGMSDLAKESSKLKGVPVFQVMRMGATADGQPLPSAAEAPLPPSNDPQMPSVGEMAGDAASQAAKSEAQSAVASRMGKLGGLAGVGGGLGGFGRKKKQQQEPAPAEQAKPAQGSQQAPPTASVLMEMQTEMSQFSGAAVDSKYFAVPGGYAQVASDLERRER